MAYRVLMIVDSSQIGGIETHILNVSLLLKSKGVTCTVLFLKDHNNAVLYERLNSSGIDYQFANGSIKTLVSILSKLSSNTVLHTHGYKAGVLVKLTQFLHLKKVVSTYHAGEKPNGFLSLYCWLDNKLSFLSKNFAVSELIAKELSNAQLFKNFIYRDTNSHYSKTQSGHVNIGFVGRISHEKGPDVFLDIAKKLNTIKHAKFHLFGDGPLKNQFLPSEYVTYHGLQSPEVIWDTLDILLITSRYEGLPMTLIEAMSKHVLVVSTAVGAIPSVIENNKNGILIVHEDVYKMSETVERVISLSVDQRQQLTDSAYQLYLKEYSGELQFKQLDEVYTQTT
ncbi:Glycosyltransferase [Pseudoalteromonas luteoviolacea B = ATCC 29581]|nr:Glycosyltransferase [Pseudoalteromonas luteoviolacea B = ATCC 29581]